MIAPRIKGPDIPGWNPESPLESLKIFATGIHAKAKELVVKDGYHSEIIMFIPYSGTPQLMQCRWQDRDVFVGWIRGHIQKYEFYAMVHVAESWMRIAQGPRDPLMNRLAAGDVRLADLPADKRIEAVVVMAQCREGYAHTWVDEMVRAGKRVALGRSWEFDNPSGRFGNLFL